MSRMTKRNLDNIRDRFEMETGVQLKEKPRRAPGRTLVLIAAVLMLGVMLAAFTHPLFTPLDGDELTLGGRYLGNGIVSVLVKNDSDKMLEIDNAKLFSWNDGEVEQLPGGGIVLENNRFAPHSEGYLTVNLSDAYDIEMLETTLPGKPKESWYYLLLTNNSFLFGHDWICSFHFVPEGEMMETEEPEPSSMPENQGQNPEGIPEELRFYFEEPYYDVVPAFNEKHFVYQQKVQELLMRTGGMLVRPVDPMLLVEEAENAVFDDAVPEEEQYRLVNQGYYSLDGYRRMVGSRFSGVTSDFVLQLSGCIPEEKGQTDGGTCIPVVFLATYEAASVEQEGAYAFLCGRILPFATLEDRKVFADEQYVVYQVTDLFYSDLDAYIDTFAAGNSLTVDERIRQRLHKIRDYYTDRDHLNFYYLQPHA